MPSKSSQLEKLRLALVGASSLLGAEVKDQLAASDVPRNAVSLFDLKEVAELASYRYTICYVHKLLCS